MVHALRDSLDREDKLVATVGTTFDDYLAYRCADFRKKVLADVLCQGCFFNASKSGTTFWEGEVAPKVRRARLTPCKERGQKNYHPYASHLYLAT